MKSLGSLIAARLHKVLTPKGQIELLEATLAPVTGDSR